MNEKVSKRQWKNCLIKCCDKKLNKMSEKRQREGEEYIRKGECERVGMGEYRRKRVWMRERERGSKSNGDCPIKQCEKG